jgi:hypothetical protein
MVGSITYLLVASIISLSEKIQRFFNSKFDIYPDLWIATMWNNYRQPAY